MKLPIFPKSLFPLGALLVLAFVWSGCAVLPAVTVTQSGSPVNDPQYYFAVGQWAEQNQDWARAAAAYQQAVRTDPASLVLWTAWSEMLMQTGSAGRAVAEFQTALKKHADNPDWIFLMGEIAEAAGDSAAAEAYFHRAINFPHAPAARFTVLGLLLADEGRETEARALWEKALALDPHERPARLAELEAAIDQDDYLRAVEVLKAALAVDPRDEEWFFRLGKVYELQGKKTEAAKTYEQLLADNPESPDARHALVDLYLAQRAWDKALPWLESLQRSAPGDLLVKRNLGAAYFELGQWDAARPLLAELEEQHRADAMTHFMLGEIFRQQAHWHLAEQELEAAQREPELKLDAGLALANVWIELNEGGKAADLLAGLRPSLDHSAQYLLKYALAALRLEDTANAATALQGALKLSPHNPEILFHLGRVFLAQKNIPAALQVWLQVLHLDPGFAEAWNHLAYTCAENGIRLEEAEGWARRAVKLEPANGNYHDTLGWVYFQAKKYLPALEELRRARDCFSDRPEELPSEICGHLGDAFEKLNRPEEALQAWRQALALNPKDARLQEKIKSRAPLGK